MARNAELNREVALKFLRPERAGDPDSRRRFLLEAEVTGRLEHPGVVPIYALGGDDAGGALLRDAVHPRRFAPGGHRRLPRGGEGGPRPDRSGRWPCASC